MDGRQWRRLHLDDRDQRLGSGFACQRLDCLEFGGGHRKPDRTRPLLRLFGAHDSDLGATLALYLAALLDDGATYGDGFLTSGGTITRAPPWAAVGIIPLESSVAATVLAGFVQGILIPPGSFRFALYNNSGASLSSTASNCIAKYRTYNLTLNN
jgi:hypothetical protein